MEIGNEELGEVAQPDANASSATPQSRADKPNVTRRLRRTGSITPVWDESSSTWRFKARFPDGRGGDVPAGTYRSELEAHNALNSLVEAARTGLSIGGGKNFFEYGAERIEAWADRRATKRGWRSTWKTIVQRAPFAQDSLEAQAFGPIRDWAAKLLSVISEKTREPISWQTGKHALGLVKRVLQDAVDDGLIPENPAEKVKMPKRQKTKRGWAFLESQAEIDQLLELPWLPEKQRSAFAFAIYAGPREGEQCALRWENVHLHGEYPYVEYFESWDTATKNGEPRRGEILPMLLPYMLHWWRLQDCPTSGWVWPSDRGGGRHARGYDFGWARKVDKKTGVCWLGWRRIARIMRRVRFHDLRHTCGSHLAMGTWGRRWQLPEIQEQLGHLDAETTQRYVHLARTAMGEAAKATRMPGREHHLSTARDAARATPGKRANVERADGLSPQLTAAKAPSGRVQNPSGAASKLSSFELEAHEIRAARDTGFEPVTFGSGDSPETNDLLHLATARTGSRTVPELLAQLAAGDVAIDREIAIALALPALSQAQQLAGLAGAVMTASDATLTQRFLALVEHLMRAQAGVRAEARTDDNIPTFDLTKK